MAKIERTQPIVEADWLTTSGLRAIVVMQELGHRCGYVVISKDHPLYGISNISHDEISSLDVHGGVTCVNYAIGIGPKIDDIWYIGFDCAHCFDSPSPEYIAKMIARIPSLCRYYEMPGAAHKSLEFCINECENLAKQLKEIKCLKT